MGGTHFLCVGVMPRGFTRKARTSRMSREAHVRICVGLEVRFLRSTRRWTTKNRGRYSKTRWHCSSRGRRPRSRRWVRATAGQRM